MKKYLAALAAVVLLGAGCAAQQTKTDEPVVKTDTPSKVQEQEVQTTVEMSGDLPDDTQLLPKDEGWKKVAIKNFGHPYTVEIHPWWHWDATTAALKAEGAVFANYKELLTGTSDKSTQFRVRIKGEAQANASTIESVLGQGSVTSCDVLKSSINNWQVCVGATKGGVTQGFALYNSGQYQWKAELLSALPAEDGIAHFKHFLSSFAETTE